MDSSCYSESANQLETLEAGTQELSSASSVCFNRIILQIEPMSKHPHMHAHTHTQVLTHSQNVFFPLGLGWF